MKKLITLFVIMFSFFTKGNAQYEQLATNFIFKSVEGNIIKISDYESKVLVVVNVASRCGFTNQYEDLQNLWETYRKENLVIIGVPTNNFNQEPGSNSEIKTFCETNFGIDFLMTEKTNVLGKDAHPFYKWAKLNHGSNAIPKWNFHKILINKEGKVADTFASITRPSSSRFIKAIEKQIKN